MGNVALLAEGVDRNKSRMTQLYTQTHVALLAEGVDRNIKALAGDVAHAGRPPRGGRG